MTIGMGIIEGINAAAFGLVSAACFAAILSRRVRDGLSMRPGLALMALGFAGLSGRLSSGLHAGELPALQHLMLTVNVGLLWCVLGYLCRRKASGTEQRRASDWVALDEPQQRQGG